MADAKLKFQLKARGGRGSTGRKRLVKEISQLIIKHGVKVFGPEFGKMLKDAEFGRVKAGSYSGNYFKNPSTALGLENLASLYQDAWKRHYSQIRASVTAAQKANSKHTKWKRNHQGRYPYASGDASVSHEDGGMMTGYLYESLDDAFSKLGDSKHISFTNVTVLGGFKFDPDSYPRRVTPYRGYRSEESSAWYDTYPYVRRYARYLKRHANAISNINELVEFEDSDWSGIAVAMQKIIERELRNGLPDLFDSIKVKV